MRKSERLAETGPPPPDTGHPLPRMRAAYNEATRYWNAAPIEIARVEDFTFDCGPGTLPLRLYHPAPGAPRPWLLYLHGGGYVVGNLDTHDCIMRHLCKASGWAVLGVDYSLAPEARFPRQIEEVTGLVERLDALSEGRDRDPRHLAFAGDSAGAHLSVSTCLEMKARGLPLPAALLLFYGAYGLGDSVSQRLYGSELDGLTATALAFYRNAYIRSWQCEDTRYDVLSADLSGLPPSYLLTLTCDPLDDDSRALAQALTLAAVPNYVRREEAILHGCLKHLRELRVARDVLDEAAGLLAGLARGAPAAWMNLTEQAKVSVEA